MQLEFTGANHTQANISCKYNGNNFTVHQTLNVDGATFICNDTGQRLAWSWQSGGECKLKDNSTISVNQDKLEGNVTYQCVVRGLQITIAVIGNINEI